MELEENDKVKKIYSSIINTYDWQPLLNFHSRQSKKIEENSEKYGYHGVYLVTLKDNLTDELFNANIGYIGKSENIFARVYDIRGGEHGVRRYLKIKNINQEDVYVKLLFTEQNKEKDLETNLHEEYTNRFGFKYSWKEASEGSDGIVTKILNDIDKVFSDEELLKIVEHIENRAATLYLENWRNR